MKLEQTANSKSLNNCSVRLPLFPDNTVTKRNNFHKELSALLKQLQFYISVCFN